MAEPEPHTEQPQPSGLAENPAVENPAGIPQVRVSCQSVTEEVPQTFPGDGPSTKFPITQRRSVYRKSTPVPRLPKLFVTKDQKRRKDSSMKKPITEAKLSSAEEEPTENLIDENPSYARVAELNKVLKQMNVHRFKIEKRHVLSIDPSTVMDDTTDSFKHPFRLVYEKQAHEHPESVKGYRRISSTMAYPTTPGPHHFAKAFISDRRRLTSAIPEGSQDYSESELAQSRSIPKAPAESQEPIPGTSAQYLGIGGTKEQLAEGSIASSGEQSSADALRMCRARFASIAEVKPCSVKESMAKLKYVHTGSPVQGRKMTAFVGSRHLQALENNAWTPELEGEYVLFSTITSHRKTRRRSYVCRQRWKKCANIIRVIRRFCQSIAILSIEKGSHLKTFADIGDDAAKDEKDKSFSLLDSGFKSKKSEPGELSLSTKVQVLMYHAPETRTSDEVTLILCDLQCFPSFCSYPLAVQYKIAKFGMFMPVTKKRVIIRQGHEPHNWYFVISGQAIETETVTKEDGTQIQNTVKFVTQGMTLAEDPILNNNNQTSTVTSRKNMQLIRLSKKHFLDVRHVIRHAADAVPDRILYMKSQPFMKYFPIELMVKHPFMVRQYYYKPNTVLVKDSTKCDWIYVIRSGSCMVMMYVESTKASWRDLELALAHPQVNIDGNPLPDVDTGPGKLPLRKTAYTVFQRMSAQNVIGSDLNQVPALRMTRGGSKNVRHGLHLLTGEEVYRMKCPWPLDFFDAMNRTAFTINLPRNQFPVEPDKPPPVSDLNLRSGSGSMNSRRSSTATTTASRRGTQAKVTSTDTNKNASGAENDGVRFAASLPRLHGSTASTRDPKGGGKLDADSREGGVQKDQRVFLTATERTRDHNTNKDTDGAESGLSQTPNAQDQPKDDTPEQSPADRKKTLKGRKKESSFERRQRYVVPEHCKPPPVSQTWRNYKAPYDCVSPPVYIHIDVLSDGDVFGLDQLKEPGWDRREQSGRVALISRGAEVVTLNKRFFMSFASDKTHVKIRENMQIYPTQQAVQTRYRLQLAWQMYSQKINDEFRQRQLQEGRRNLGTFFKTMPRPIGNPYAILKEEEEEEY